MLQQKTTTHTEVLPVKTYLFQVELVEEDDGRWSAGVPMLPGCATWGYTREEALHNIHDAVEAYIRDMQNAGEDIPKNATTQVIEEPVVAVTV
jgi:predicted RNase H-like HicB family nuclease